MTRFGHKLNYVINTFVKHPPDNLLTCLLGCLKLIFTWVVNGVCPNYFSPAENMFERLSGGILRKLSHGLQDTLRQYKVYNVWF